MGAKIDYFSSLPDEVIVEIALSYPDNEIDKYCILNKRFNRLLCRNNVFWYRKLNLEFPNIFKYEGQIDWNLRYRSIGSVYASGDNRACLWNFAGYHEKYKFDRMEMPLSHPQQKFRSVCISNTDNKENQHIIMIDTDDNLWGIGASNSWGIGSNKNCKITVFPDESEIIAFTPLLLPNFSAQPLKTKTFSIVDYTQNFFGNKDYIPMKALDVSCGRSHTVVIDTRNNIWVMGENGSGQLGLDESVSNVKVSQILFGIKAISVSCYKDYTALIDLNNDLYVMGRNDGQLGVGDYHGDYQNLHKPTLVPYIKATRVSAGYRHMTIIDDNNNVWLTGTFGGYYSYSKARRIGDRYLRSVPVQIEDLKAIMVSSGDDHSLILDVDLNVWIIGWYHHKTGHDVGKKKFTSVPILFENIKCISICAGSYGGFIIDINYDIWVYGLNHHGQLGLDISYKIISIYHPIKLNNIKAIQVAARNHQSVLISL
jgi:alpha-tubulin suppressor-like RCC1 family protein